MIFDPRKFKNLRIGKGFSRRRLVRKLRSAGKWRMRTVGEETFFADNDFVTPRAIRLIEKGKIKVRRKETMIILARAIGVGLREIKDNRIYDYG